jgi:hypothetical protein
VSFRGNRYSVPPELSGARVTVSLRLGAATLDIATTPGPSPGARGGVVLARHRRAPTGAGVMVRDHGHVLALETAAMAAATSATAHRGKERRPPTPAALAAAELLLAPTGTGTGTTAAAASSPAPSQVQAGVVVDLARYAAAAAGRNTLDQE